jgi:MFS family permease
MSESTGVLTAPRGISATTKVLGLLCVMYFINYVVRVNVSTAAAVFQPELGLTNLQVGEIFSAFAYPYLAFQILGGWVGDRFGARRALTVFAITWSSATVLMGLSHSLTGMVLGRILLGIGVSALPVATRAMSNWTAPEKRGFAQGITHAFARLGNALTAPRGVADSARHLARILRGDRNAELPLGHRLGDLFS